MGMSELTFQSFNVCLLDSGNIQCKAEDIETAPNEAYISHTRDGQSTGLVTTQGTAGNKPLRPPDEAHILGLDYDYVQNEASSHTVIETKENPSYSVELPKKKCLEIQITLK